MMEFGKELEMTMRLYQKQKSDPPIGRNMPPIAGLFNVLYNLPNVQIIFFFLQRVEPFFRMKK